MNKTEIVERQEEGAAPLSPAQRREKGIRLYAKRGFFYYDLMMLPGMLFLLVFNIIPIYGLLIAFQDFIPSKGIFNQEWVGFENFIYLFDRPETLRVIGNTFKIALLKIVFTYPVPVIFALLMNEVRHLGLKKGIQTVVYLPNFISWVVMAGIILDMFALENGVVNKILGYSISGPSSFWAKSSILCRCSSIRRYGRGLAGVRSSIWLRFRPSIPRCTKVA